ncbi:uncharacterized protein [Phaseolus vulgaris]|uniref:uncharacterized protein n=1 Tax=Phaseolus vulgaris TaxID=3885 RepID=UPI0035C9E128
MESWEGLDIDDNDIGSYVRRCNSTTNVISGPAGNVQAMILNRNSEQPVNPQEFINRIGQQTYDRDFTSNQWKWAEKFLQFQGEIEGRGSKQRSFLGSLKELDVFPLLSCLIKSCKHNGLGDMLITIKDPTGTASASVHGKVLKNEEFGSLIEVGSVLVLKNVGIFTPNRRNFYLNITLNNIVKVFNSDICPPTNDLVRACHPVVRLPPTTLDAEKMELLFKAIKKIRN